MNAAAASANNSGSGGVVTEAQRSISTFATTVYNLDEDDAGGIGCSSSENIKAISISSTSSTITTIDDDDDEIDYVVDDDYIAEDDDDDDDDEDDDNDDYDDYDNDDGNENDDGEDSSGLGYLSSMAISLCWSRVCVIRVYKNIIIIIIFVCWMIYLYI